MLITRRAAILVGCAVAGSTRAWAAPAITAAAEIVDVNGAPLKIRRYVAPGTGPRSTVLILHGSKGLDAHLVAYERYAVDLAVSGMDALLFSYYGPGDLSAINDASNASGREALYAQRIGSWVSVVRAVAKTTRSEEHTSESSHSGESRMPSSA